MAAPSILKIFEQLKVALEISQTKSQLYRLIIKFDRVDILPEKE